MTLGELRKPISDILETYDSHKATSHVLLWPTSQRQSLMKFTKEEFVNRFSNLETLKEEGWELPKSATIIEAWEYQDKFQSENNPPHDSYCLPDGIIVLEWQNKDDDHSIRRLMFDESGLESDWTTYSNKPSVFDYQRK